MQKRKKLYPRWSKRPCYTLSNTSRALEFLVSIFCISETTLLISDSISWSLFLNFFMSPSWNMIQGISQNIELTILQKSSVNARKNHRTCLAISSDFSERFFWISRRDRDLLKYPPVNEPFELTWNGKKIITFESNSQTRVFFRQNQLCSYFLVCKR